MDTLLGGANRPRGRMKVSKRCVSQRSWRYNDSVDRRPPFYPKLPPPQLDYASGVTPKPTRRRAPRSELVRGLLMALLSALITGTLLAIWCFYWYFHAEWTRHSIHY